MPPATQGYRADGTDAVDYPTLGLVVDGYPLDRDHHAVRRSPPPFHESSSGECY